MYAEWIGPSGLIRELDKVDGLLDIHLRFLLGVHQQVSGLTLLSFLFFFFPLGLIVQITITMSSAIDCVHFNDLPVVT